MTLDGFVRWIGDSMRFWSDEAVLDVVHRRAGLTADPWLAAAARELIRRAADVPSHVRENPSDPAEVRS